MYCFILKILSHSSKQQNVCTHTHPNGHARKCCQITLVHTHYTHMDKQEALRRSSQHNEHMHKRISSRCTPDVPGSGAEPQRNARTAPSSVATHTHAAKATKEQHRLRRPPPPLLPAAAAARRQEQSLEVEEVSCAPGDQQRRPRRSIGHGELHLRAATEHP